MSPSTRTRAGRGGYASPRGQRRSGASQRRYGFSEEAGLLPGQFKLLIDENLSPKLVKFARRRGFPATHVNEVNLRTADDKHIARYAVDNGMILVTNNMADFTRLYQRRELHPGLIFLQCDVKGIFNDRNQATMLSAVLDELIQNDLIQEALRINLIEDTGNGLIWRVTRYRLPAA